MFYVLEEQQLELFISLFKSDFYYHEPSIREEIQRKGMFNLIDNLSGYTIDFIIRKDEDFRRIEFSRKQRIKVFDFDAWVVSIEDLIISKIIWTQTYLSNRQLDDVKNLLKSPEVDKNYVKHWCEKLRLSTYNLI